jgi:hypothetical protein
MKIKEVIFFKIKMLHTMTFLKQIIFNITEEQLKKAIFKIVSLE